MSAIWGHITYNTTLDRSIVSEMTMPYKRKCKIDKYSEVVRDNLFFSCGIQHIQEFDRNEVLPIYDKESHILFTADCILDSREVSDTPSGQLLYEEYKKHGLNFVHHVRGLFSVAIYHEDSATLHLIADPVSSRCLYYYLDKNNHSVSFSTLLEPIKKVHPEINFSDTYLNDYIAAPGLKPNIEAGLTTYQDVFQVKPGTIVTITSDRITEKRYYDFSSRKKPSIKSAKECGEYFRSLYEDCVRDAIKTDGNVGISLSSGLDSASVGALAATELKREGKDLFSYTYVPYLNEENSSVPSNYVVDETKDVEKIAALHSNMRLKFMNNEGKNAVDSIQSIIDIMEMPVKAYINFPNLIEIYNEAHNDGCKIVLLGQNGNGSVSFGKIDDVMLELYEKKQLATLYKYFDIYCKKSGVSTKKHLLSYLIALHRDVKTKKSVSFDAKAYTFDNPFILDSLKDDYPLYERFAKAFMTYFGYMPIDKTDYIKYFFHDALFCYIGAFETKLGLFSGVVLRDPTADVRMLKFCYNLPTKFFAYMGTPRWLIRENLRDILPNDILDDWNRYGLQNSDCYDRIRRDWERLSENFNDILSKTSKHPKFNKYLKHFDFEKLSSFIKETPEKSNEWEHCFDSFIFSLNLFLTILLL